MADSPFSPAFNYQFGPSTNVPAHAGRGGTSGRGGSNGGGGPETSAPGFKATVSKIARRHHESKKERAGKRKRPSLISAKS